MPTNSEVLDLPSVRLLFVRMIWKPCLRALLYLYHTERKTPDCSPGDTSESASPCFVVYLFYTVGPTGIHACGAVAITKPPTNV
jgi:hypothetical protein